MSGKKEIRIFLEERKSFNTTAGVIRNGEVARPASGAQLPRANQQVKYFYKYQFEIWFDLILFQSRWIPPSSSVRRDALPQDKEQLHNDVVFRRVRGILNKITPEKFEKLINDILNIIGNGSNTIFKGVILLVS